MRSWIRLRGAIFVVSLVIVSCGGEATDTTVPDATVPDATLPTATTAASPTPAPTTAAPPPTTAAQTTTTAPPTTLAAPAFVAIDITVADGEVSGPDRVEVNLGSEVRLSVMSDEADEVHFHGYDIFADVAPGAPARMVLVADIPGVFEVELEGAGLELVLVEVK